MPRHLVFAAGFAATCAVIVPLAWHPLAASIEKDGKKLRPLQQEFTCNGTRVTLDVDRELALVGDSVTATLRAYSDTVGKVPVDVRVYYTSDTWGSRVAQPPQQIDVEHITLTAAPDGGKPVQTSIKLDGKNKVNTYRIFVAPHGAEVAINDEDVGENVAAASIMAWAGNDFAMSIQPEGKLVPGEPFTVAVRIKNTTTTTYHGVPYIQLGTTLNLYGVANSDDISIEEQRDEDGDAPAHPEGKFRPGRAAVQRFKVTPKNADQKEITFVASAYMWREEMGPVSAGAMEATTIRLPRAHARVARK
jgi:hypothetical protein